MSIRKAQSEDAARIRAVASSAMSSAYAVSPDQIEAIVDDQFGDDAVGNRIEGDETTLLVSTVDGEDADAGGDNSGERIVGVADARDRGDRFEVRWLFVDPEFRDHGHGTALFEELLERASHLGGRQLRAATLARNERGSDFCERFGFERVDDREVELGGETFVEDVSARRSDGESDPQTAAPEGSSAREGFATDDGRDTGVRQPTVDVPNAVVAEDGTRVYLDRDDPISGTESPFFQTFGDDALADPYGYFCGNCGSTDVDADSMDRLECAECGNQHRPRDDYDASYL
ncbi:MAG: GNAT family N-acetyltransferase [Salinigranum sp.]